MVERTAFGASFGASSGQAIENDLRKWLAVESSSGGEKFRRKNRRAPSVGWYCGCAAPSTHSNQLSEDCRAVPNCEECHSFELMGYPVITVHLKRGSFHVRAINLVIAARPCRVGNPFFRANGPLGHFTHYLMRTSSAPGGRLR